MKDHRTNSIALFDSGVGGISVLRRVRALLPNENYIYYGDSARAPWGDRSDEEIIGFSDGIVQQLLSRDAKCIVIACNTATSRAAAFLREKYPELPIIGIEPAVKPASFNGDHPKVLVLATRSTIEGPKMAELVKRHSDSADIHLLAAPGLVEFVESGIIDGAANQACRDYIRTITAPYKDADCVVLGCTHFPFLRNTIMECFPPETICFDGAEGVARRVKDVLAQRGLLTPSEQEGGVICDNSDASRLPLMELLLHA